MEGGGCFPRAKEYFRYRRRKLRIQMFSNHAVVGSGSTKYFGCKCGSLVIKPYVYPSEGFAQPAGNPLDQ